MSTLVAPTPNQIKMVGMGQIEVGTSPETLGSILGSCVGVCLYSADHSIGALAHIVMPRSQGPSPTPGKAVDTAIPEMIQMLADMNIPKRKLTAKIAGGASMFKSSQTGFQIGQENIKSTLELLSLAQIPIIGRELGGDKGRRIHFDLATGRVKVEIMGAQPVMI